ncbi:hypothetical protein GH975_09280 [Litorivicinus lipolyticus]|jgi:hypothetical protein|uniref:Tryptophan synthase subunit beta like protein n=1 Tax=Litorivicinus lipolyticus TaxID=418701 RepID=A0A5Q2QFZ6_9GAMM|nr:hypothetical protein [Litorivicinus lipolyticus]QGG80750.1 hypothetical protein GH975_09280 [Litorivicinus lipolyticus]
MPYIQRNTRDKILALYATPNYAGQEFLDTDSAEVAAFLGTKHSPNLDQAHDRLDLIDELTRSDMESIRIIDDLVELLVKTNSIRLTDLPEAARAKLLERKRARAGLTVLPDLLDDEEPLL